MYIGGNVHGERSPLLILSVAHMRELRNTYRVLFRKPETRD
jgi:hypothetical protein